VRYSALILRGNSRGDTLARFARSGLFTLCVARVKQCWWFGIPSTAWDGKIRAGLYRNYWNSDTI